MREGDLIIVDTGTEYISAFCNGVVIKLECASEACVVLAIGEYFIDALLPNGKVVILLRKHSGLNIRIYET